MRHRRRLGPDSATSGNDTRPVATEQKSRIRCQQARPSGIKRRENCAAAAQVSPYACHLPRKVARSTRACEPAAGDSLYNGSEGRTDPRSMPGSFPWRWGPGVAGSDQRGCPSWPPTRISPAYVRRMPRPWCSARRYLVLQLQFAIAAGQGLFSEHTRLTHRHVVEVRDRRCGVCSDNAWLSPGDDGATGTMSVSDQCGGGGGLSWGGKSPGACGSLPG